jgi:succinate dehydrogenase / fumarate reductase cytochrome b subunit
MAQTGVMILAFLIYHILHFTLGVTNPDQYCIHDSMGRHHVFNMVVLGFQNIFVSSAYIVGQFFLAVHISHAFFSIFQTIGFNHPQFDPKLKLVSNLLAFVIFVGNSSMPIAVLLNFIQLSTGGAC